MERKAIWFFFIWNQKVILILIDCLKYLLDDAHYHKH